jgi:hypothetical protein
MARYKVELDLAQSPLLQRYFEFKWGLVGNLGIDLLVIPFSKLLGLERAVKLIMIMVPPLTVGGILWIAREVHGRVPPSALFALPLAYNFPLHFGFVNFSFAMALGLPSLGLWLTLGRLGRLKLRAALFVPLSLIVWISHVYAWAVLGIAAFCWEWTLRREAERSFLVSGFAAALACMPLAPPVLAIIVWRSGEAGGGGARTEGWFSLIVKANYLRTPFRERWAWWDHLALAVVLGMLAFAIRSRRFHFSRGLLTALLCLGIAYILVPSKLFGSSYADMRLLPFLYVFALVAIGLRERTSGAFASRLALVGMAFVVARTAGTTAALWLYGRSFDRELAALDHVPRGARLLTLAGAPCRSTWKMDRFDHIGGMAVVRREAFTNDQWQIPGGLLLRTRYPEGGAFTADPSQIVRLTDCRPQRWPSLDESLRRFPRAAFDYLWLVNAPPFHPALVADMQPVWRSGSSIVYRIGHPPPAAGAKGPE